MNSDHPDQTDHSRSATASHDRTPNRLGITLTRAQLECWADRALTDAELDRLENALPQSTLPDTVGTIAAAIADDADNDDDPAAISTTTSDRTPCQPGTTDNRQGDPA